VRLNRTGASQRQLAEDTIDLIRRLAVHHADEQIAAILNREGRRTGTGLAFTRSRVHGARFRARIPLGMVDVDVRNADLRHPFYVPSRPRSAARGTESII
jgi:hypothetical protein